MREGTMTSREQIITPGHKCVGRAPYMSGDLLDPSPLPLPQVPGLNLGGGLK
jgi:hypothetical protein